MTISEAIKNAEQGKSRLTKEMVGSLKGMSSPYIWHFLSNIVDGYYLEVGTWKGSTLKAALYGKPILKNVVAIDNFSEFGKVAEQFKEQTSGLEFTFIEDNCFNVRLPHKFRTYFYDGNHSEGSQYKALTHFIHNMEPEFTYIVDDYNEQSVQKGTERAIHDLKLTILEKHIKLTPGNGHKQTWWNGFAVYRLRKNGIQ